MWSTQRFYELESGVRFPIRETTVWCLEEERLFVAEDLQSVELYERILAATEGLPNIEQEEARAMLEWRRKRTDPPRCLSCGSPDIVPLPAKGGIAHPGCRGKGELRYEQLVRHESPGGGSTYDSNGHFVRYAD